MSILDKQFGMIRSNIKMPPLNSITIGEMNGRMIYLTPEETAPTQTQTHTTTTTTTDNNNNHHHQNNARIALNFIENNGSIFKSIQIPADFIRKYSVFKFADKNQQTQPQNENENENAFGLNYCASVCYSLLHGFMDIWTLAAGASSSTATHIMNNNNHNSFLSEHQPIMQQQMSYQQNNDMIPEQSATEIHGHGHGHGGQPPVLLSKANVVAFAYHPMSAQLIFCFKHAIAFYDLDANAWSNLKLQHPQQTNLTHFCCAHNGHVLAAVAHNGLIFMWNMMSAALKKKRPQPSQTTQQQQSTPHTHTTPHTATTMNTNAYSIPFARIINNGHQNTSVAKYTHLEFSPNDEYFIAWSNTAHSHHHFDIYSTYSQTIVHRYRSFSFSFSSPCTFAAWWPSMHRNTNTNTNAMKRSKHLFWIQSQSAANHHDSHNALLELLMIDKNRRGFHFLNMHTFERQSFVCGGGGGGAGGGDDGDQNMSVNMDMNMQITDVCIAYRGHHGHAMGVLFILGYRYLYYIALSSSSSSSAKSHQHDRSAAAAGTGTQPRRRHHRNQPRKLADLSFVPNPDYLRQRCLGDEERRQSKSKNENADENEKDDMEEEKQRNGNGNGSESEHGNAEHTQRYLVSSISLSPCSQRLAVTYYATLFDDDAENGSESKNKNKNENENENENEMDVVVDENAENAPMVGLWCFDALNCYPLGFVTHPIPKSQPIEIRFRPHFTYGALMAIAWNHGVLTQHNLMFGHIKHDYCY